MPQISIILPAYNAEKTIKETIDSVINQTFKDFELIIINDGSTDRTLDIISSIDDPRVQVFSYPNSGASVSRNRGFSKASAQYIAFLDADDLWTPDKLELQYAALEADPEASVAYSWTNYIDQYGEFLYPGFHQSYQGDVYSILLVKNFLENGSNPLITRHALSAIGGFDESLKGGQDWDLYLRLAAQYKFVCISQAQILYRISEHSISSNIERQESSCLSVLNKAFNNAPSSLKNLKKDSLSHLYSYLTFKSLESPLTRKKARIGARCFWMSIYHDPGLIKRRSRMMAIVFVKIMVGLMLPNGQAEPLLKFIKEFQGFLPTTHNSKN
ncbi:MULTISPECIES: glycosyltransferase [Arthrospira]|uniref:Glycosyl transferase n=1 Tax=Limnospira platensis NIES-46 TaxID=1236695 RepID=A0A5M3TBY1_LIMPL|nr:MULTISPECIES: glycosyltransferase [Arthrospira]AMW28711.1 glycosyl transferase family A [Arthrospira platensis YZ]KDR56208.1 glycosyl transferase family A [Arthrospira platensis str. Paraca]MBD2670397.1 glycosyltransferase [Arthrospira platensis FACHB-439]MDF2210436.1 glycosyltransferase [Arthrospira platensis NCB002]MDT9183549.1 glycosyltransferase [Limnospira sp. PMC 289.06]MDT9295547.1 glycosyltransferase [Arthrospira platensis PCC 7345]MDT9311353.1 glycosyltransferase [Limnospira sp. 